MSLATRQRTCAACGHPFTSDEPTNVEPLVDEVIRYVATCQSCTTHPTPTSTQEPR